MHVALLGSEQDPQIQHLAKALHQNNTPFYFANTQHFGSRWTISYDPDFDDGLIHFNSPSLCDQPRVTFSNTKSAYWHEYLPGLPLKAPSENARNDSDTYSQAQNDKSDGRESNRLENAGWIEQERASTLLCWFTFSDIKWVNTIDAVRSHQCKPLQSSVAGKLGAHIPYTFVGNAPEVASQFCSNMREVVYKPVRGGRTAQFVTKPPNIRSLLDTLFSERPVTFQKYIAGVNVRSYVLGKDVLSVQIDSSELDYRNDDNATVSMTNVPREVQQLAIRICQALGMHWCAIDWRKSAKGKYFFLEANPSPYFLKVENDTGLDITAKLVALLVKT
ncbi:ATP-grasp domain-containing protein [Alteromonas sp. S015]|uniref:ATP-grasp domain-containing protein n=1 Tax=Alteromonas sp. S015 TaxID=3117401 RepID=UPI002FE2E46A